jgi:shikimate 5-dehydrogenase
MTEIERDQNLMLVYAVEGYSMRHNMSEKEVFALFRQYGINHLIRKHYNALHTQDLDESISFAEDILLRKQR